MARSIMALVKGNTKGAPQVSLNLGPLLPISHLGIVVRLGPILQVQPIMILAPVPTTFLAQASISSHTIATTPTTLALLPTRPVQHFPVLVTRLQTPTPSPFLDC